jgi:zinc finger SWIM domain-containing protein 3
MQSNQRSESLNSVLHNHLDRKMSLVDLMEHYEFRFHAFGGTRLSLM